MLNNKLNKWLFYVKQLGYLCYVKQEISSMLKKLNNL